MKQVIFLKEYEHSKTRTWQEGDTPTISNGLAKELKEKNIVKIIGNEKPMRGIGGELEEIEVPHVEGIVEPPAAPKKEVKRKKKSLRRGK